jgi:hypothetical protein
VDPRAGEDELNKEANGRRFPSNLPHRFSSPLFLTITGESLETPMAKFRRKTIRGKFSTAMKPTLKWTGLFGAGLLLPCVALERPSNLDTDLPLRAKPAEGVREPVPAPAELAPAPSPRLVPDAGPQAAPPDGPKRPQAPSDVAYLGLGVSPLPEVLAVHLGLQPNAGVVVRSVDPEGPAAAAGVQAHDVIRSVNGTVIHSHDDLRAITAAHAPGDALELSLVQKGHEKTVTAQLAGRPAAPKSNVPPTRGGDGTEQLDGLFEALPREQAERIRRAIEENLRFAEDPQSGGLGGGLDEMRELQRRMLGGMHDLSPQGTMKMSGTSSVRLLDGDGSVEIEVRDGVKEVRVRDRDNKVVWEGPYSTDKEKASVPEKIRARIDRVDLGTMGSGFEFHFGTEPADPKDGH